MLNSKAYKIGSNLRNIKLLTNSRALSVTNRSSQQQPPLHKRLSYEFNQHGDLNMKPSTIGQSLTQMSLDKPNDVAYKFCLTQKSFTFLELKQRCDELAQNLLNMGFKKGDNLAVLLPNIPEAVLVTLAAGSIGVTTVLMNPAYQLVEIEFMLKKTKAKGLFMFENLRTLQHYDLLCKICPELVTSQKGELNSKNLPDLKHIIMSTLMPSKETESKLKGIWSFNEIELFNKASLEVPNIDIDDTFAMLFTSGSTGFPKAATMTHNSILNVSRLVHQTTGCSESFQSICLPIPIFHTFGLCCGLISPLSNGNKTVFPHILPDPLSTIKAIASEKCKTLKGAPTIFTDIINHPELKNHDMSSLETMLIGASTVPKDLLMEVKEKLGLENIIIGYAMTESTCGGLLTNKTDKNFSEKAAYESIGRNFLETKIRDPETNEIVPRNTDGEICLRGFSIMKGYYEDEEKTKSTIDKNGWLLTGDIGCMDEDGYVYFKSRAKELVIRGGVNIYPSEIEKYLRTHPDVVDCYVVGVPDERLGEELCVWIKMKPDAKGLDHEAVREFCKGQIAHFKIPKYVKIVDAFPVSATAKIQKFKMIDQMKIELNL